MNNKQKTSVYVADVGRNKLSNRLGWIDLDKKGDLENYLRQEVKLFPEAIWFRVDGFDFSPISNFIKR